MNTLKQELTLTTVEIEGNEYTKLSLPLKELCERTGVAGFRLYDKLEEIGFSINHQILLSQQDIDDYYVYEKTNIKFNPFREPNPREKFDSDIHTLIANSGYFDIKLIGQDGKVGLIDTLGHIVVPPTFDSAEGADYLFCANYFAVVGKDGKLWMTPRDGSGHIINKNRGYDSVIPYFNYAYVIREGKHGLVNLITGEEIIPSEMDWLKKVLNDFVFARDGKIGYYSTFAIEGMGGYFEPVYEAINLTTRQFMRDGQWGWLFEDGSFSINTPYTANSLLNIVWDAKFYIDDNPNKKEQFFSLDDIKDDIKTLAKRVRKEFSLTPANRLNLPAIRFPKGYKAYEEIEKPLIEMLNIFRANKLTDATFWFGLNNDDCKPLVDVHFYNIGKGITMRLEWVDSEMDHLWRDIELPEKIQKSLNVILSMSKGHPKLTFCRIYEANQISMLTKFLSYYLIDFCHIQKESIRSYTIFNK